jgi:hypothetical protein
MQRALLEFWKNEHGAVSKDWITLSVLTILLAVSVVATMQDSSVTLAETALDPRVHAEISEINAPRAPTPEIEQDDSPAPMAQPPD